MGPEHAVRRGQGRTGNGYLTEMTDLYLSLGSNIGNRRENLLQAIASLDERLGCRHHSLSGIIETDAWNFEGEKFRNCAVLYKINLPDNPVEQAAEDILRICKGIEKAMGRTDEEKYSSEGKRIYQSRVIDIDILFLGKEKINTRKLTIPHKGIANRPFVMIPLLEIAEPSVKESFPEIFQNTRK